MTDYHWTEVDGIPTIWAETDAPLTAGLLFRTGAIDESVPTSGYTHLIEHMAIAATGDHARHSNGLAAEAFTGFYTTGHQEDVTAFLGGICKALANLPGDRLDAEKQILAAENRTRGYDLRGAMFSWRFGATGYGLMRFPGLGAKSATLEQLQAFSAQRFTRENAILWLNSPVPKDLRLDLPAGTKRPLPELKPILANFPCFYTDDNCGGVAIGATVPRVSASSIFNVIAQKRLQEQLRVNKALSYSPAVMYDPITADTAHLILYADSEPNRRVELSDAFGEVFEGLAVINDAELESARKEYLDHMTGPLAPPLQDRIHIEIQRAAIDWILGRENDPIEVVAAEMETVTTADITAFLDGIRKASLIALPSGAYIREWAGERAPNSLGERVKGREVHSVDYPIDRVKLVHGLDGVSLRLPDATHYTVRYHELAGAVHYDDGGVILIGNDATWLTVEPTLWRKGRSVSRAIYDRLPGELLLEHGDRPENEIPKPKTTAWQRFIASLT